MPEKYFLKGCIRAAEDVRGSYAFMSHSSIDIDSKEVYRKMITDIDNHLGYMNSRLKSLKKL